MRVADQLSGEPQERLLEVVVGLGRDVVVLQILFAVEGDGLGLDFALLHVHLVAAEDDRDVFTHSDHIPCVELVSLVRTNRRSNATYCASWERSCT